jgi:hypothetical protein
MFCWSADRRSDRLHIRIAASLGVSRFGWLRLSDVVGFAPWREVIGNHLSAALIAAGADLTKELSSCQTRTSTVPTLDRRDPAARDGARSRRQDQRRTVMARWLSSDALAPVDRLVTEVIEPRALQVRPSRLLDHGQLLRPSRSESR